MKAEHDYAAALQGIEALWEAAEGSPEAGQPDDGSITCSPALIRVACAGPDIVIGGCFGATSLIVSARSLKLRETAISF